MSALQAILAGLGRGVSSPVILVWLCLVGLAVAAPAAWIVAEAIEDSIGSSRAYESMHDGFDMEWYGDFKDEYASGLSETFTPTHTGVGAFLDNLESWIERGPARGPLPAIVFTVVYALLWLLMLGGVIDRFADRKTRPGIRRFFKSGGRWFFRYVRLALIAAPLYAAVYWSLGRTLKWISLSTMDVTVEATIMLYGLLVALVAAVLLTMIHACFGFAKVAAVVDDRRSMFLAAVRGLVFIFRHPLQTAGLYYGFLLISGTMLGVYWLLAPGVGQTDLRSVAWALGWGQLFLLVKMYLRLSLLAGQTALYQSVVAEGIAAESDVEPQETAAQESLPLSGEASDHYGAAPPPIDY